MSNILEGNLFGRSGLRPFRTQPLNFRPGGLNRHNAPPRGDALRNYGAVDNLEDIGGSYFKTPHFLMNRFKKRDEKKQEKDAFLFEMPEDFSWRDNDNDKAERSGQPPDDVFVISEYRPERFEEKFFGPRYKNLIHISRKTGAHLNMPRDPTKPTIEIWGDKDQIAESRRDLKTLEQYTQENCRVAGKKESRTFTRIRAAPSYRKLEAMREQSKEIERNRQLRRGPTPEMVLPVTSYVIWPKDIPPTTYFGRELAALDPIRADCNCFVTWDANMSAFFIQGSSQENVLSCKDRIFGLYCEIAATRRAPVSAYLVDPPAVENIRSHILINTKHPYVGKQLTFDRNSKLGALCSLTGTVPNKEFLAFWKKEREVLKRANWDYIRRLVRQGIDDIYYMKGHLKMKVNFGTIIFESYKKPNQGNKLEFDDFMESMHDEKTRGEMIRDIGGLKVAGQVYAECLKRPDIFTMVNYDIGGAGSENTTLQYTIQAVFEIRLYRDDNVHDDVRLDVEFAQDSAKGSEEFNVWSAVWTHIPQKMNTENKEIQMNRNLSLSIDVLNLDADCGYNIEFSKFKVLPDTDIYPIFPEFLRHLKIEKVPDDSFVGIGELPKCYRVSYVNLHGLHVNSVTQKTKHQFWMGLSDYIFEVVKYEHISTRKLDFPANVPVSLKVTKDALQQKVEIERRYGAGLYSYSWQHHLAGQRQKESIGKSAQWEPCMDTFFPLSRSKDSPDGVAWDSGWEEFKGRVQQCLDIIITAKRMIKEGQHVSFDEGEAVVEPWDQI